MRPAVLHVAMLACLASGARAQGLRPTIVRAEAEGASFAHADPATSAQRVFSQPFGGSSDRRCAVKASLSNSSWRSGEFIIRAGGLEAGKDHKILWIPLHGGAMRGTTLLLRAVRVGHPADSVRLKIPGPSRGDEAVGPTYAYPSTVFFPKAGQWLVVARAKDDWGCFVLDVAQATREGRTGGD